MEGIFLPGFRDMGLERSRDECSDERVTSAEDVVCTELFLNAGECGVVPQVSRDLSPVFDSEMAEVAVALLQHEVICLPDLFGGGSEEKPGICEARFAECGVDAVFVAVFLGLGFLDVGRDGGAPRAGSGGRHFG